MMTASQVYYSKSISTATPSLCNMLAKHIHSVGVTSAHDPDISKDSAHVLFVLCQHFSQSFS